MEQNIDSPTGIASLGQIPLHIVRTKNARIRVAKIKNLIGTIGSGWGGNESVGRCDDFELVGVDVVNFVYLRLFQSVYEQITH